jgi:threonine dehydratase
LTSRSLDRESGCTVFFKCENFQRTGSFKIRGASQAVHGLTAEQKERGVVAHSSGNFAQAIALAASSAGVPVCVVMPRTATRSKLDATRAYGAEVVLCEPTAEDRERLADELVAQRQATLVHPSNDLEVIRGQATAAIELFEQIPDLEYLFVPIGGGGLIAGCCLAAREFAPACQVVGAEPLVVDDAYRSLISGRIERNQTTDTIADGLKTYLGDNNFPIIQRHVKQIVRVSETQILDALNLIWQRMKIVVEPSAAVPLAALLNQKQLFENRRVGVLISGGNVDVASLRFLSGADSPPTDRAVF